MVDDKHPTHREHVPSDFDEGGLRAPPGLTGWRKAWWWFDFIILVKLARLRFIAVLVAIGVVITQWDLLAAYYDRWTRPAGEASGVTSDVEWFCPMHPSVVRDNGKEKCPICFMPLSKRKKGESHAESLPAGVVNRVQLSPYRVVLAGIRTWQVSEQPLTKEINAVGYVEFNERLVRNVSARIKGRIDTLQVNETGQIVQSGDVLASVYSPELLVTVQNLLQARGGKNPEQLNSVRTRLSLLGISDDQIDEIIDTGKANTHLKIRSPITGHVIKKYVREGQYVDEGMPLYDVADLSSVWIQAQIYEDDLAFLPNEQVHQANQASKEPLPVQASTRAFPGEVFEGALTFIYPHVDQESRTVAVRFELPNPGHKLRPGTTMTVRLQIAPKDISILNSTSEKSPELINPSQLAEGKVIAIPESAVIDTGRQTIAYRQTLPGVFEGVEVVLGPRMIGLDGVNFFPVLKGLALGESVVTAGSFLVDAETRLNPAAGSIYFGGSSGSKSGGSSVTAVRPTTPEDPDAKIKAALGRLSEADRVLAEKQRFCPILPTSRLGSMGTPIKLMIGDQPVFVCCAGCKDAALAGGQKTVDKARELSESSASRPVAAAGEEQKIAAAIAELPAEDQALARAQRFCPVLPDNRLGSMGKPELVVIDGQKVLLCCEGCKEDALADPKKTLEKVRELKSKAVPQSSAPK